MSHRLIDISEGSGSDTSNSATNTSVESISSDSDNTTSNRTDDKKTIVLVEKYNTDCEDPEIMSFIRFCIDKGIFDNTFYDYTNAYSIIATKLPVVYEKLESDEMITRERFVKVFAEYGYSNTDSLNYIFDKMGKGDDTIDELEFINFFLPFVRYVTY